MSSYPDFREQGYQVIRELGRNREGGRITWLASNVDTEKQVVLKQFCFAQAASSWSGFEAHRREIQVLQGLNHPNIPGYLNSFGTPEGFCLVQEYINAPSLAEPRSFTAEQIKQIAVKSIEILVYLQNRIPVVIHRDIKPENILLDEQLNVYLIDFGFARIGSEEVAASSVFKGTPGFIPPEQMFEPTEATDLYALGATLICLLIGIKSTEIHQLRDRDDPYLIQFRHRLPRLSLRFLGWLEKMVQPRLKERFSNAQMALEALKPLDVIRVPGVDFSETVFEFKATRLGEKLTQSVTIDNLIPETLLEGRWEVAPHPHDPPHTPDYHTWISITPSNFSRNHTVCRIEVDTSKLIADKQYKRQLILHSNAYPETHTLTVKVQTAPIPIEKRKLPYAGFIWLFLMAEIVAMATTSFKIHAASAVAIWLGLFGYKWILFNFGMITLLCVVCIIDRLVKRGQPLSAVRTLAAFAVNWAVSLVVAVVVFWAVMAALMAMGMVMRMAMRMAMVAVLSSYMALVFLPAAMNLAFEAVGVALDWAVGLAKDSFTTVLILLILGFGASVGTGFIAGFPNPFILLALAGTGLPMLSMLIYSPISHRRLIAKYRRSEELLIKP